MNVNELNQKIDELKSGGNNVLTNCFKRLASPTAALWKPYYSEKTVMFVNYEYKVNRLIFYTTDFRDMKENVFPQLPKGEYCMDILTKNPEEIQARCGEIGLIPKARMKRFAVNDVSAVLDENLGLMQYFNSQIGTLAQIDDAPKIYDILWRVFDVNTGHLPDLKGVEDSIKEGEFTWYSDGDKTSLLQTVTKPKSLYINQIYNANDKSIIHAILLNKIKQYCIGGGKYMFAWIEENNIASLKFHSKYNMSHDGLWNIVFKIKSI